VVAHLLVQKFSLGVPHYRLEQHLEDPGIELGRGTMCRYAEEAGNALGATIVHAMWQDALANGAVISTDATSALIQPVQYKKGQSQSCKKGHFFTAVVDTDHVLFAYAERHTQDFVKKLFDGFKGFLQCDAHNVYDILERGPQAGRRGRNQARGLLGALPTWLLRSGHLQVSRRHSRPHADPRPVRGGQRVPLTATRQAQTDACPAPPSAARQLLRLGESGANAGRGSQSSDQGPGDAFNQEKELRRVLDDGRLPLDNTRSERSLRKIVVGRKNWMFYGSDTHAESAAAIFSVITSCRLHSLDPERYLDEVLRVLPYWPKERMLELAAKHWQATRAKLRAEELDAPLCSFTIPAA
jgi:hypothetical protein